MPIISGILKDGAGVPLTGCTIQLRAVSTSRDVLATTMACISTNTGQYHIEALPGQYDVFLRYEGGLTANGIGIIHVYDDSPDGTLNSFLNAKNTDTRPEVLRQFEALAQQTQDNASKAAQVLEDAINASIRGEKGDTGEQGLQGPPGPKGDKGDTGPQGIPGPKGDTGPRGLKGDTGPKGDAGPQGDTGLTGPKGDKGDTGPQGEKGDTGLQGIPGPPGKDGAPGLPGKDSTTTAPGEVGSYVFAMNSNTYLAYGLGGTVSGSSLSTSGVYKLTTNGCDIVKGSTLTGTWECQGYSASYMSATLWKRIA